MARLALIDDEDDLREALGEVLESFGHEVDTFRYRRTCSRKL